MTAAGLCTMQLARLQLGSAPCSWQDWQPNHAANIRARCIGDALQHVNASRCHQSIGTCCR
eukprot:357899-Chlamydomonas_euryale.AAC.1